MRARFYSPDIKRFVNMDVLVGGVSEVQSLNRFAFVSGNPVKWVDPFGLAQEDLNRAIDIVKTFLPPIYSDQVKIQFGNTFKWWNPRHWIYRFIGGRVDGYTIPEAILIHHDYAQPYIIRPNPMTGMIPAFTRSALKDLLTNVIHEYQHAIDYQRHWWWTYEYLISPFGRHTIIYQYSEQLSELLEGYMLLSDQEWECIKADKNKIGELQVKSLQLLIQLIYGYQNLPVDEWSNP